MIPEEIETILAAGTNDQFEMLVNKFITIHDLVELHEASHDLLMRDLVGSTTIVSKTHARIHEFGQKVDEAIAFGTPDHTTFFAAIAGIDITEVSSQLLPYMIQQFASTCGNSFKAGMQANSILDAIFRGMPPTKAKMIRDSGGWDVAQSVALQFHHTLTPVSTKGKKAAMLDILDKKNEEKIRQYYASNYTQRVIDIYNKISTDFPNVSPKSFVEYIKYKIGAETSLMEFRIPQKNEWSRLDEKYGMVIDSMIKTMYNEGLKELKVSSLWAKNNLWHMILDFVQNTISMQAITSSVSAIVEVPKVVPVIPHSVMFMISKSLDMKLKNAVSSVKKIRPDISLDATLDFFKDTFVSTIGETPETVDKTLRIKFGMPVQKIFVGVFNAVKPYVTQSTLNSPEFVKSIFHNIEGSITKAWYMSNYTFEDLYYDLLQRFTQKIDELIKKMMDEPGANTEVLMKTFDHYTKAAANRVIVEYKDIPPFSPLDRKFNSQINFLLKEMYDFSCAAIESTMFEIRFSVWNQIERVLKDRIMKASAGDVVSSLKQIFDKDYKAEYLEQVELLTDSIHAQVSRGMEGKIPESIPESQQSLLLFFQENLGVLKDKRNTLSESLQGTARGYFDEIEGALKGIIEAIKKSSLSKSEQSEVLQYIYEIGRNSIHKYLGKHES